MRETLMATDCWFVWNGGSFARERSGRKPLGKQEDQQPSTPSRARLGACSVDCVTGLENPRFSGQPAAEAALIFCNNT